MTDMGSFIMFKDRLNNFWVKVQRVLLEKGLPK